MTEPNEIEPIENLAALESLIDSGYTLVGPRKSEEADKKAIERFFNKGHVFFPERCLVGGGCTLVEPSVLSKGLKIAYTCEGEDLKRYFLSNYYLQKGDEKVLLYLRMEEH